MIASCPRQADPSGLCLSQVHSSFSNNGSPSACHEQLCSCECEFVFSGLSLLRHSYDCHSIELQPLKNLFRLLDCLDDCCLVLSHSRNVLVPLQCVGPARTLLIILPHLHHRHLTLDTLELWEPDAAPSWEHWQSHQSSRSVTTFKSSCASDSNVLAFHHNGHLHNLIHEQYL